MPRRRRSSRHRRRHRPLRRPLRRRPRQRPRSRPLGTRPARQARRRCRRPCRPHRRCSRRRCPLGRSCGPVGRFRRQPPRRRSSRCFLGPRRFRRSVRRRQCQRCCRLRLRRCLSTRCRPVGRRPCCLGSCWLFRQAVLRSSSLPPRERACSGSSSGRPSMHSGRMSPTIRRCRRPCPCCRPVRRRRCRTTLCSPAATGRRCR